MRLKRLYKRFRKHLSEGGVFYAFRRGVKYLFYCVRTGPGERYPIAGELMQGDLRVAYGPAGLHIFWKDFELSLVPGLSCAVSTWGLWTDSSKADWHFLEEKEDSVKIRISFKELPLSQVWSLKLREGRSIAWSVDLQAHECLHIDEFRFLSLLKHNHKTWVSGYSQGNFPRLDHDWHDLWIKDQPGDLVAVRFPLRDDLLPAYSMEVRADQENFAAVVQNPPSNRASHFIGFRTLLPEDEKEYAPGTTRLFSATITVLEKEGMLDSKIEERRQADLKKAYPAKPQPYDILLIQCPPWDPQMPPLGLAYLASSLKKYGYAVGVADLNIELFGASGPQAQYLWEQNGYDGWVEEEPFGKTWERLKKTTALLLEKSLKGLQARALGLSVNYAGIKFASRILPLIKEMQPGIPIILGGWACITEHLRKMLPVDDVDLFVVGEGEQTLREILEALRSGKPLESVAGTVCGKNSSAAFRSRPPVMDLDEIPWPTFEEFDLSRYKSRALPLFTSRGCVSRCAFCNDWFYSKPYRSRSPQNIFEEIRYHVAHNGADTFSFKDLLCNGDLKKLDALCDFIIASGIEIHWDSHAIPLKGMGLEFLRKLRRAGCASLIYGVESFSDNVLRRMHKMFTREIVETVLKDTHEAGIQAAINIIAGFPGETEEDFQETLRAIERNRRYISRVCSVNPCLVNPDSELESRFQDHGLVFPEDDRIRAREWSGANSYELRKQRTQEVFALIRRLSLPCNYCPVPTP